MRLLFAITTMIIAIVIGMAVSLLLSAKARVATEKKQAEIQLLHEASHLVEFASTLRASEEVRQKRLTDLESARLQQALQSLWDLRHESNDARVWAVAIHDYLQKHKVPLDETILTDPALLKPSLSAEE